MQLSRLIVTDGEHDTTSRTTVDRKFSYVAGSTLPPILCLPRPMSLVTNVAKNQVKCSDVQNINKGKYGCLNGRPLLLLTMIVATW